MIIGHTLGAFLSQDPTDWHGVHIVSLSFGDCPGLDRQLAQLARLTVWGRASRLRSEIVAQPRVLNHGTRLPSENVAQPRVLGPRTRLPSENGRSSPDCGRVRLRSEIVAQRVLSRGTPTSVGNITRSAIRSDRLDVTDPGIQTQAGLRPRKVCSIP